MFFDKPISKIQLVGCQTIKLLKFKKMPIFRNRMSKKLHLLVYSYFKFVKGFHCFNILLAYRNTNYSVVKYYTLEKSYFK